MFGSLWHYLKGYVIVEVSGYTIAKFLNVAMHHQIPIWDIKYKGESLYFKTSIQGFKDMRPALRKARCRAKMRAKKGVPFIIHRYQKRKVFVAGLIGFIVMIWLLSSFVWLVDIEGAKRLSSLEIMKCLESEGYKVGKLKSRMNLREAEQYLLKQYPDIIWTGIHYEGTRMVVSIAESVPRPEMQDLSEPPKNIISRRDALVTYVEVQKGQPLVKVGDIVQKGQILVAGEMIRGEEDSGLYYTPAKAQIHGKTIYFAEKTLSLQQEKKNYLNQVSKKYFLKTFDKRILLYQQKAIKAPSDKQVTLYQLRITNLFPLPFGIEVETQVPYESQPYTLTETEAKDALLCQLWGTIEKGLGNESRIIKREAVFQSNGNTMRGILHVLAEEDIGYQLEIKQDTEGSGKGESGS